MTLAKKILLALTGAAMLLALFLESVPARSAEMKHDMAGMAAASDSPATVGYQAAMDKMHREMMAIQYSGDADIDFVRGMIPHHQAAVDMAKVLLEHGKDPAMRKLARNIVSTQEAEIKQMENWLEAHPAK